MRSDPQNQYIRYPILFGLFSLIIVGTLGLGHITGMKINDNGDMEGCIYTGKLMICKMDIIEHISLWQRMFTAVSQKISPMELLLTMAALTLVLLYRNLSTVFRERQIVFSRILISHQNKVPFLDYLRRILAKGILQPKIYERAL